MKHFAIPALAGLVLLAALPAAADEPVYGFLDGSLVGHDERFPEREHAFGGRLGVGVPLSEGAALEIGAFGNDIRIKQGPSGDQLGLMLDYVRQFGESPVRPFLFAGIGAVQEEFGPFDGTYPAAEFGLGLRFGNPGGVNFRASVSGQGVFNDEIDPDQSAYLDGRFTLGLVFPFGAGSAAPVDSDGDGVPDKSDRCPVTAGRTADGCPAPAPAPTAPPKDSDKDGVDDSADRCPGTLAGLKVDDRGCAIATTDQSIVLKGVNFLPSSAELTPEAKQVLDQAAASLSGQKDLNVELGGHTDANGDDKVNLALSQKRADSVRQYLIGKGVAAERLTAKGYGESQPIADNKTTAGRKSNRRVELKIVR